MLAERILVIAAQAPKYVSIQLEFPIEGDKGEFGCSFSIAWPEGPRTGIVFGCDAIQAIMLAMNMIAANLYASAYHKTGQLLWDKQGAGYGFPLTHGLKDLAQGDDKLL